MVFVSFSASKIYLSTLAEVNQADLADKKIRLELRNFFGFSKSIRKINIMRRKHRKAILPTVCKMELLLKTTRALNDICFQCLLIGKRHNITSGFKGTY